MTDRELLELAAKAVGKRFVIDDEIGFAVIDEYGFPVPWNPLNDDGDALRLAHSLEMTLETGEAETLSDLRRDIVRAAVMLAQQEQPQ